METIKAFLKTTTAKRALWTLLNSLMAIGVSYLTFLASDNVTWAISVLPVATALSQFITKYLNK